VQRPLAVVESCGECRPHRETGLSLRCSASSSLSCSRKRPALAPLVRQERLQPQEVHDLESLQTFKEDHHLRSASSRLMHFGESATYVNPPQRSPRGDVLATTPKTLSSPCNEFISASELSRPTVSGRTAPGNRRCLSRQNRQLIRYRYFLSHLVPQFPRRHHIEKPPVKALDAAQQKGTAR